MAKVNIKKIIKDLGDTNWSKDNEAQMKAIQLLKGLAVSDDDLANKFMEKMDKYSTTVADAMLEGEGGDEEYEVEESIINRAGELL